MVIVWANDEGHQTMLMFDHTKRIQWFFDPNHTIAYPTFYLPVGKQLYGPNYLPEFQFWLQNSSFCLLQGQTPETSYEAQCLTSGTPGMCIQGSMEGPNPSSADASVYRGACSTITILFIALLGYVCEGTLNPILMYRMNAIHHVEVVLHAEYRIARYLDQRCFNGGSIIFRRASCNISACGCIIGKISLSRMDHRSISNDY